MIALDHVHPMLVHFPIVLFIAATIVFLFVLFRRGNIAARSGPAAVGTVAMIAGLGFAFLAAFFGDIALDAAVGKGFARPPLEAHEELAVMTMIVFSLLSLVLLGAMWRRIELRGGRGWMFAAVAVLGVGLLLDTAYHGGDLVYVRGVNVDAVAPAAQQGRAPAAVEGRLGTGAPARGAGGGAQAPSSTSAMRATSAGLPNTAL